MSYVDGSDGDYGGDYPSKNDTVYDYTAYNYDTSANSLGSAIVASYGTKNYSQLNEPSCSEQEIKFKAPLAAAFTDERPSLGLDAGKQDLDRLTQKMQDDFKADPGKYSLQCFGPPSTQPTDFWEKAPEFPFPEQEREEEGPEIPEKLYKNPFFKSLNWRTRLVLEMLEKAEEEWE